MNDSKLEARIEAIELFLQQLVFLLEVESDLTKENISAWLMDCRSRQRDRGVTSPPVLAAFGNLVDKVLELTPDPDEPNPAARRAAALELKKAAAKRPPKH